MESVSSRHLKKEGHVDFFVHEDGRPLKFRIQPGLGASLRTRLENGITAYGGLVISKIPITGLVVIDPKSHVGRELMREWSWNERPERCFVSHVFVFECIDAKQLLPMDKYILRPGSFLRSAISSRINAYTQCELSKEAKDKLALYLATILPNSTKDARSSDIVFQRLVKNKHMYPWVRDYNWETFRNHYCENKKYFDKLIDAILDERVDRQDETEVAKKPPAAFSRKQFLIKRKTDSEKEPTIVEVVIPSRKENTLQNGNRAKTKRVKFGKPFFIERKRKFGDDVTNEKAETEPKRPRTLDDMLNASLPPVVAERTKGKLSSTQTVFDDIETGRATKKHPNTDVWFDDTFRSSGEEKQATGHFSSSGSRSLDRFQESLSFYGMDFDDLRSAAALDKMDNTSEVDYEDETSVAELLGLPTAPLDKLPINQKADSPYKRKATLRMPITPIPDRLESRELQCSEVILELAQCTRFTVEEIEQKLTGFAGDLNKTHDFFIRCRQLIEDLFAGSSVVEVAAVLDHHREEN